MKADTQDVATTRPASDWRTTQRTYPAIRGTNQLAVTPEEFDEALEAYAAFCNRDMLAALKAIAHCGAGRNDVLRSFMEHNSIPYLPTESPSEWMAHVARWAIALAEKTA